MIDGFPVPKGFRPAGEFLRPQFSDPPALRRRRYTGRRRQGIQYEKAVHEYLGVMFGDFYLPNPWLKFFTEGKWRWCQPDGLIFRPDQGRIVIVEVKYQHTADAWFQVRQLYQPLIQAIFPPRLWAVDAVEVVKWYDPLTIFPERVVLASSPDLDNPAFKVHIWKP